MMTNYLPFVRPVGNLFSRKVIIHTLDKASHQSTECFVSYRHCSSETKSHITVDNIFLAANVDRIKDAFLRSSKHTKRYPGSSDKTPKQAAVLVPFCLISGEPAVIFILRPGDLSNHGAEVW